MRSVEEIFASIGSSMANVSFADLDPSYITSNFKELVDWYEIKGIFIDDSYNVLNIETGKIQILPTLLTISRLVKPFSLFTTIIPSIKITFQFYII